MRSLWMNPVLNKEIKLRFRSVKGFLGIFFYLFVLGAIALGFIFINSLNSQFGSFRPEQSRFMFILLTVVQLGLIFFMTPGLTAGVISGEREKQTLNILLTTPQSSSVIVISKLLSSISYLLLMIVASLPLYSIVFLFGGVSPGILFASFGIFLVSMVALGSIGILFSTLFRKTIVAMITTYGTGLFLAGGTGLLTIFLMNISLNPAMNQTSPVPFFTAVLNPFIILVSLFEKDMQRELVRQTGIETPMWIFFLIAYLLITVVSLLISIKKLRPKMG